MKRNSFSFRQWFLKNRNTVILLLICGVIFFAGYYFASPEQEEDLSALEYSEYEKAKITKVLMDSTEQDENSDGGWRGEQLLIAEVLTGQYKGETLQVSNFVGPLYGVPLYEGDGAVLIISTFSDGLHTATVYEFDRAAALAL